MGVYNNLVVFDNTKKHESAESVVPDLAESWSWNAEKTKLTFKLRQGVKWHDGKPFTAKDVQCTWHMLTGKTSNEDFRQNPRAIWWQNLSEVTLNGDHEVTFNLKEPQPAFLLLLASGYSPVYSCHVPQRDMRTKPVGTGPFKFVEFKRGELIRLVKNPDYFKKGLPYLDGDRFQDRRKPFDAHAGLPGRRFRHDIPDRRHGAARPRYQGAVAEGDLRIPADRRHQQPDRQPRKAAVRQRRYAQGDVAGARPGRRSARSWRKANPRSAAPCCRRRRASGACRRKCWRS